MPSYLSTFPASLDTTANLGLVVNNQTPVNANIINALQSSIFALENVLGINPAQGFGTVAAFLQYLLVNGGGGGGSGVFGGDLVAATSTTQTVIGIQGHPVSSSTPTAGQTLQYNGTAWIPATPSSSPTGLAGGDLGASYPNPSVLNIHGASVPTIGVIGNVLQVSGSSSLSYGPVNLAGGSNYVVGTVPVGNLPSLAGDTTGQITSNSVVKIQGRAVANIQPTDGYALTWVNANSDWEPKPASTVGILNIVALRAFIGTVGTAVILGGYRTAGDGGGGTFYWDSSSHTGDDGATIIVPTGSTTGRWLRSFDGSTLSINWFGAYGDGIHDDTAAIQAACNWGTNSGITINFPARNYLITAPYNGTGAPAIYITKPINLIGTIGNGGNQPQTTFIINGGGDGYIAGSGLLFEPIPTALPSQSPAGSLVNNIYFTSISFPPRNTIIIHTNVNITNCLFSGSCTQHAILIDSGNSLGAANWGTGFNENDCMGFSYLPAATYCLCDNISVSNCEFYESPSVNYVDTTTTQNFNQPIGNTPFTLNVADSTQFIGTHYFLITLPILTQRNICGAYQINSIINSTSINCQLVSIYDGLETPTGTVIPSGAQIQCGASFHNRGVDAGASNFTQLTALLAPNSFKEGGQVSNTWTQCYSQDSRVGYFSYIQDFQPIFIHCGSEDFLNGMIVLNGQGALLVSPTFDAVSLNPYIEQVGGGASYLNFLRNSNPAVGGDGYGYGCVIPEADNQSPLVMQINDGNNNLAFGFGYNNNVGYSNDPYAQHSLIICSGNQYIGAYGVTGSQNNRGTFLSMFCSPTMNTQRHWKWKQSVSLVPGNNIIYLNGGSSDGGGIKFLDDATGIWSLAQSTIGFNIEYSSVNDLTNNNCYATGYHFITEGAEPTYRNAVANVYNPGSNTVSCSLVWNFDIFVTNFNSGSGSIG